MEIRVSDIEVSSLVLAMGFRTQQDPKIIDYNQQERMFLEIAPSVYFDELGIFLDIYERYPGGRVSENKIYLADFSSVDCSAQENYLKEYAPVVRAADNLRYLLLFESEYWVLHPTDIMGDRVWLVPEILRLALDQGLGWGRIT